MARYFNTEGLCAPDIHYMVNLSGRLRTIKKLFVDRGKYFIINRGRQYGKTTMLRALAQYLKEDYLVVSMDFQLLSTSSFEEERQFVAAFAGYFVSCIQRGDGREGMLDLRSMIEEILYQERRVPFSPDVEAINIGKMFGLLEDQDGQVAISNRIFEMRLLFEKIQDAGKEWEENFVKE